MLSDCLVLPLENKISDSHTQKMGRLISKLSLHICLVKTIPITYPKTYQAAYYTRSGYIFGPNLIQDLALGLISMRIVTHHMAGGEGQGWHTARILQTSDWQTTEWWEAAAPRICCLRHSFYITSTTHDHCALHQPGASMNTITIGICSAFFGTFKYSNTSNAFFLSKSEEKHFEMRSRV